MLLLELLLGLIRFLLGAALFSFMNVVAWRLPRGMDPLKGRSVCPQCGHTLGAPDLVPVFSWLFLRGRCRHCGAHIPARYLLVELLGGVLALGCTWRYGAAYALPGGLFGMSWAALLALAVCGILLSVSLIDAETQTIPDRLNLALAVFGAVSVLLSPADWLPHVIGALCVSVPMFLLCLVIDGAFGGGDIKLMAAAGLFLGWQNTLLAMFFGIVFGGMYGIYLLAAKKAGKKDHFAFGPFLCAGIVIAMLFGGPVLEWYCAFLCSSDRQKIAFLPYCVCRGDHWSPVNLPQQRFFRDSCLTKQTGTGEQCSPLQEFFDNLKVFNLFSEESPSCHVFVILPPMRRARPSADCLRPPARRHSTPSCAMTACT